MRSLEHPNIVRYLGADVVDEKGELHIFQEWVPGGSITDLLKQYAGRFSALRPVPLAHGESDDTRFFPFSGTRLLPTRLLPTSQT